MARPPRAPTVPIWIWIWRSALRRGTPYSGNFAADTFSAGVADFERRAEVLRAAGGLRDAALKADFADRRFEQIAESNAIEGSPLSVRETQLAVQQGVTISGHDPSWSADAVNLNRGLDFAAELARSARPVSPTELRQLHALILGDSPWAGEYRRVDVEISGSAHTPPPFAEVESRVEEWAGWSRDREEASALLRAIVLSTWLTHIHPFRDGNGRVSRAIMNLELIRGGLPIVIIRKRERERYYEALGESDAGANLGQIAELIVARAGHALDRLERTATAARGCDRARVELERKLKRRAAIWSEAVRLLVSLIDDALAVRLAGLGEADVKWYTEELDLEDYQHLCQDNKSGNTWVARIEVRVPGVGETRYLAWTGYRSQPLEGWKDLGKGPAIRWSVHRPEGYPRWQNAEVESPGFCELTVRVPDVDRWIVRTLDGAVRSVEPSYAAGHIADAIIAGVQ